jgi:hypothetical protein
MRAVRSPRLKALFSRRSMRSSAVFTGVPRSFRNVKSPALPR